VPSRALTRRDGATAGRVPAPRVRAALTVLLCLVALGRPAWAGAPAGDPVRQAIEAVSAKRIEADIRRLAAFGTRHTLSDTTSATRGIGAAARWVQAQFDSISAANGGRLRVVWDGWDQEPGERVPSRARLANVVAILPGTSRGAVNPHATGAAIPTDGGLCYVVGGHLDSRAADVMDAAADAPGANDDGSGVAVALECARAMAGTAWDHTLVFIAFTGEEQSLLGSTHWAQMAAAESVRIGGMIADDIVGNTEGGSGARENGYVRVFSEGVPASETPEQARVRAATGGENDSPSRQWARFVREAAEKHLPDFETRLVFRRDRFLRGGDHAPFNRAGFAAVRMSEAVENYDRQHQDPRTENGVRYGDLPESVDFEYVADVARANVAALGEAAAAPASPRDVVVDVSALAYDTTLRWEPNRERDLAGYRVLWRTTTEPVWTRSRDLGPVTEVTLPLSKDDFVFGLQARDRDGHLSPAVVPLPKR